MDEREIIDSLRARSVPGAIRDRLQATRGGFLPWTATLRPAELAIARSHGLRPIAAIAATCWMHYAWSWTEGHAQGWETALQRLRTEAAAAGANAVLDVRMRTVSLPVQDSMDFSLVGTAVHVEGLGPSPDPIVATVPALEFVQLVEADIVPTGIAVGARYDWLNDWSNSARQQFAGNVESRTLSTFWESVRRQAQADLRRSARPMGNGVLAHVNFSQMFEVEGGENQPRRYLGRQIIIGTVVDTPPRATPTRDVHIAVTLNKSRGALRGGRPHHQSYDLDDSEGGI